jgi:parallel beta-helix repeat protein
MNLHEKLRRRTRARNGKQTTCVAVEVFEQRLLLATIPVISTNDSGAGSLRAAILQADLPANTGSTIDFAITPGSAPFVINLATALPVITQPTTIDGTSQAGFSNSPLIELNGGGNAFDGLTLGTGSDQSQILGLDITNFIGAAINIQSTGNIVSGNFVGPDISQTIATPGNNIGILINNVAGNFVGEQVTSPTNHTVSSNTIGLNTEAGVSISGAAANGNLVVGNFIGTDANGAKLANQVGIQLENASNNTIGGTLGGTRNIISLNNDDGVLLDSGSDSNTILGNFIGTDVNGTQKLGNLGDGISVFGSTGNTVGGTATGAGNVISDNAFFGVFFDDDFPEGGPVGATNNQVVGNLIGTDVTGTQNLGNMSDGVSIGDAECTGNSIGGTAAGSGNVIAFNAGAAVSVHTATGVPIRENRVFGNGAGILLIAGGNNNQAAPKVVAATSVSNLTTVDYQVTGTVGQSYAIDFFASGTLGGPAAQFIGSATTPLLTASTQSFTATFSLASPISPGQTVTATATSTLNNTSVFATSVGLSSPLQVTNTKDNVQGSEVGSLRQAILDANNSPPTSGTDVITFAIPGTAPFVISPTTILPGINVPVTIDGTTEPGVQLSGGGGFAGLTLAAGAGGVTAGSGSIIRGLTITGFTEAIVSQASNNTIGGTTTGAGNVFTGNTVDAIHVANGTGNTIRQNVITLTGPAQGIVVDTAVEGSVSVSAVASVPNLTTIDGSVTATAAGSYTVEFFASSSLGPGPAAQFLGSTVVTFDPALTFPATLPFTAMLNLPVPLVNSQTASPPPFIQSVTATVTDPNNSTSEFATSAVQPASNPFLVTNTTDNVVGFEVGSLRQAILNADAQLTSATISFALPGIAPFLIRPTTPLPAITVQVDLDGTSQSQFNPAAPTPVIQIDGGLISVASDVLVLGAGSNGTVIRAISITGFTQGAGIHVQSNNDSLLGDWLGVAVTTTSSGGNSYGVLIDGASNNTIGGTALGDGEVIGNNAAGVQVSGPSASGNQVLGSVIGIDPRGTGSPQPNGYGVVLFASGNTIGDTIASSGGGNTIGNSSFAGVYVGFGIQNVIRGNLFAGMNGTASPVAANDIFVSPGANNNQTPPTLASTTLVGNLLTVPFAITVPPTTPSGSMVVVDFYWDNPGVSPAQRSFLARTPEFPVGSPLNSFSFTVPQGFTTGSRVIATETIDANGTSAFSGSAAAVGQFTVTNTSGSALVPNSLAAVINTVNDPTSPANPTVTFQIPPDAQQVPYGFDIQLIAPLVLTRPAVIDGFTEAAFLQTVLPPGSVPAIIPYVVVDGGGINGPSQPPSLDANLVIEAGAARTTIEGLVFNQQSSTNLTDRVNSAILLEGGGNNAIGGNYIGTDVTGTSYAGNLNGIVVDGSNNNTIGGPTEIDPNIPDATPNAVISLRNVISANDNDGIIIQNGSAGNVVQNAFIGTDPTGTFSSADLVNFGNGIEIDASPSNTIGGSVQGTTGAAGTTNVISGNNGDGILIQDVGAMKNVVINSYIGTDSSGTASDIFLANGLDGIAILNADSGTRIGDPQEPNNVISGNLGNGISIKGTSGVTIQNDYVGTDSFGLFSNTSLSNALNGVLVDNSTGVTIGGTEISNGATISGSNVISGNLQAGIRLQGSPGAPVNGNNLIQGNKIGTTATGNSDIGNGTDGIEVVDSPGNTIGGTVTTADTSAQNIITGNNGNGVLIAGIYASGMGNLVQGNIIGAKTATSQTAGNAFDGVALINTTNNVIGTNLVTATGTVTGTGNVIAGNGFGSFTRTQLFSTGKKPSAATQIRGVLADSFLDVAAGVFSNDLSYRAVVSQTLLINSTGTTPVGSEQIILFSIDPTGTSVETDSLELDSLHNLPAGQYQFAIYTGKFLLDQDPDGTVRDDLLLTVTGSTTTGSQVNQAYIFEITNQLQLSSPAIQVPLKGSPLYNGSSPVNVAIGEFQAGGQDGFAVAESNASAGDQLEVFGDVNVPSPTSQVISIAGSIDDVIAADFTPSGLSDLAVANAMNKEVDVFLNQNGLFGANTPFEVGSLYGITPTSLGAGVFDNNPLLSQPDLNTDLVVVDSTTQKAIVFQGDGNGSFQPFPGQDATNLRSYAVGVNPGRVIVGDFEGSGVQDITVLNAGNSSTPGTVTELSGLGDGTFRVPTNFDVGLTPTAMVEQTLAGDTTPVLVVSNLLNSTGSSAPIDLRINLRQLSARRSNGIAITGNESGGNLIYGNSIGIDINGNVSVDAAQSRANAANGVFIEFDGSTVSGRVGNTIGSTVAGAQNVISGNQNNGILLVGELGSSQPDQIVGNLVGTDATGEFVFDALGIALGNILDGIRVEGLAATISDNVISGNGLSGIDVERNLTAAVNQDLNGTTIVGNFIGTDQTGMNAFAPAINGSQALLPLGNSLDGILLDNVDGVTIGGATSGFRNLISGNQGRGIEIRGDLNGSGADTVLSNLIGTNITGEKVNEGDNPNVLLGNLGDGVFLLDTKGTTITGNAANNPSVISGNRGYGIHAVSSSGLNITGTFVGTDLTGTTTSYTSGPQSSTVFLGNGADGVFLDQINGSPLNATVSDNIISGNRADGIDLLDSSGIQVIGNKIGTGITGVETNLGNASSGIFVNESTGITIGGTTLAEQNIISGNLVYGVALSALVAGSTSHNLVSGNYIGIDASGDALPNGVSGVLISNAIENTIGGLTATPGTGAGNVISANNLDGIELITGSTQNLILGNLIGTDPTGQSQRANHSDGIFLIGAAANTIGGPTANAANVISGNSGNGIQIFGSGSTNNSLVDNFIGVNSDGTAKVANGGSGVYLNSAGNRTPAGANTVGPGNLISGNNQQGVLIAGTNGDGGYNIVRGNFIGTDKSGTEPIANGGNGVFIYGTSANTIGGTIGIAPVSVPAGLVLGSTINGSAISNLISGNAQAGINIFSPAKNSSGAALAADNVVAGNLIGTNAAGSNAQPLGNQADGVDIFSSQSNTVGEPGGFNVISGNLGNGVLVAKLSDVEATSNLIDGNYIGTNSSGNGAIPNDQNGVLFENAYGNTVGGTSQDVYSNTNVPKTPNNVISGNLRAGVEFSNLSENMAGNAVVGNYIGVTKNGTGNIGNGFAGVFINNLGNFSSKESIGGSTAGAGNIISGSASGYGVDILGPVAPAIPGLNVVEGNLVGIDVGSDAVPNMIGIFIQNSAGNMIGGLSSDDGNVISANSQAGVELSGLYSTQNTIGNNLIGTKIGGTLRPGVQSAVSPTAPLQMYGVFIATPSPSPALTAGTPNNVITTNVISGNQVGVNITGQGSGNSGSGTVQGVPFGQNLLVGNLIGTNLTGLTVDPNFEYGVYIDNSAGNTIGGTGAGQANIISANGIDGIEIFGGTTQISPQASKVGSAAAANVIINNLIGVDKNTNPNFFFRGTPTTQTLDGPVVALGEQLYGIVIIGSSSNVIGRQGVGNQYIGGNSIVGVYITRQDFQGNIFSIPNNNNVSSNHIIDNGIYGVYRYEAPNNPVALRPARAANLFAGNPINVEDFNQITNKNNTHPNPKSKHPLPKQPKAATVKRTLRPKAHVVTPAHKPKAVTPTSARPRVPALFHADKKSVVVAHVPAHPHR